MQHIAQHKILVAGESLAACAIQVNRFFDLTSLVIYDCIQIVENLSYSAESPEFHPALAAAVQQNHRTLETLIRELTSADVQTIDDLRNLPQGYPSKTLHIIAHLLDGFVGIDSYFYNVLDDSHWLPDATAAAITDNPGRYWLVHIDGYSATPAEASLLHK